MRTRFPSMRAAVSIRLRAALAGALPVKPLGAVLLLASLLGCAPAPAGHGVAKDGSGSGSLGGSPGLFRGDRVTIDRDYIYLDDPLFLQSKSVYAYRKAGFFTFQIPIYFNASQDTLRFAFDGIRIRTSAPKPSPADPGDSLPALPQPASCVADTGEAPADSAAVAALFADTGRALLFPPGRGRNRRVHLNIHCRGYDPPWGRVDTLSLAFARHDGAEIPRDTVFDLPFHVSFRGPVVSILLGVGLLYGFTQAGLWISGL